MSLRRLGECKSEANSRRSPERGNRICLSLARGGPRKLGVERACPFARVWAGERPKEFSARQIVNENLSSRERVKYQRFDFFPFASSQAAADTRHVNACLPLVCLKPQPL